MIFYALFKRIMGKKAFGGWYTIFRKIQMALKLECPWLQPLSCDRARCSLYFPTVASISQVWPGSKLEWALRVTAHWVPVTGGDNYGGSAGVAGVAQTL